MIYLFYYNIKVGYVVTRIFWSVSDTDRRIAYSCEIEDKDNEPEFVVKFKKQNILIDEKSVVDEIRLCGSRPNGKTFFEKYIMYNMSCYV